MSALFSFRKRISLSQDQLATWLRITRPQIAHVEKGKRMLTKEAGKLFFLFDQVVDRIPEPPPEYLPEAGSRITFFDKQQDLNKQLKKCRLDVLRLESGLVKLEKNLIRTKTTIAFCKNLKGESMVKDNPILLNQVDILQQAARLSYASDGPRTIAMQKFYLKAKKEEASFLAQMIVEWEPGPF